MSVENIKQKRRKTIEKSPDDPTQVDALRKGFWGKIGNALKIGKKKKLEEKGAEPEPTVPMHVQKVLVKNDVIRLIRKGKRDEAMKEWRKLDNESKKKYAYDITQEFVAEFKKTYTGAPKNFDAKELSQKKADFYEFNKEMQNDPEIGSHYAYEKRSIDQSTFNETELRFLAEPREVLEKLAEFPAEEQQLLVKRFYDLEWLKKVIFDPESKTILKILKEYPSCCYWHKLDRDKILKIHQNFTPEERQKAAEKIDKSQYTDWDTTYTLLSIADLPQSTGEQIRALSHEKIQQLVAVSTAYGKEKIAELWNEDNVLDFIEIVDHDEGTKTLINFAQTLSPTLKKHLPAIGTRGSGRESQTRPGRTIWFHKGFHGLKECIREFYWMIQQVPEERREEVFAALAPAKYTTWSTEKLSSEEVDGLLDYIKLMDKKGEIELRKVMEVKTYLGAEQWPKVKAGIDEYRAMGLAKKTETSETWMQVFEKAGRPEHKKTNQFVKACMQKGQHIVLPGNDRRDPKMENRSEKNILAVYDFAEKIAVRFGSDFDETAEYVDLGGNCRQIIAAWTEGKIQDQAADFFDTPLIEGEVSDYYNNRKFEKAEWFQKFTTEQKRRWLFLKENIRYFESAGIAQTPLDKLYTLIASDEGADLEAFIRETGLTGYDFDTATKMASRPDCAGLFYHIKKNQYNPHCKEIEIAEKLIAIHDAGLSQHFHRQAYDKESVFTGEYGNLDPGNAIEFLKWEPEKFATIANKTIEIHPDLTLVKIAELDPEASEEVLLRRIKRASLQPDMPLNASFDEIEIDELEKIESRMKICRSFAPKNNDDFFRKIRYLSDRAWDKFSKNPEMLKAYLDGKGYGCSDEALLLPDEMLIDEKFWHHDDIPQEYVSNIETLKKAIKIAEKLKKHGIELPKNYIREHDKYINGWNALIEAYDSRPWLFEDEALSLVGNHITKIASCDQVTWEKLKPLLQKFELTWWNADELIQYAQTDALPLPVEIIAQIQELFGETIKWEIIKEVKKGLEQGESFNTIKTKLDENEHSWKTARCEHLKKKLEPIAPELCKYNLSIERLEQLLLLPEDTLRKINRAMCSCKRWSYYFGGDEFENWIHLASHPNYETMLELFKRFGLSLLQIKKEKFERLCFGITPESVQRLNQFPEKLWIQAEDMLDFLAEPNADTIIALSKELKNIFGDELEMTVYDLLIMDPEEDLKNIKYLKETCFLPVTSTNLRALALIATGETKITIERLLAMFNKTFKIDPAQAIQQIEKLETGMRAAVMLQKGPGNFGHQVLKYKQELKKIFNNQEEFEAFVMKIYDENQNNFETKDMEIIEILINNLPDKQIWGVASESIKQTKKFWEILCEKKPIILLEHFDECKIKIDLSGNFIQKICDQGTDSHINQALDLAEKKIIEPTKEERELILVSYCQKNGMLGKWLDSDYKKSFLFEGIKSTIRNISWNTSDNTKKIKALQIAREIYGEDMEKFKETVQNLEEWGYENFEIYAKLIERGVITKDNHEILEKYYLNRFPAKEYGINETIIKNILGYSNDEEREAYMAELESIRQHMISSQGFSAEERQRSELSFLIKTVFPKGNYGNYETNEKQCEDQTEHLAGYKFNKEGYPIELSGLLGYKLRDGQEENVPLLTSYQQRIQAIRSFVTQRGPNNEALKKDFEKKVDGCFEKYADDRFKEIGSLAVKEKMLCIFISQIVQKQKNPEVLDLLVEFKYVYAENLENYIQHSADDVKRQRDEVSQHRALWMELGTIYGENMKHVMRHDFLNQETQQSENIQKIVDIYGSMIGAAAETPTLPQKQIDRIRQTFENDKIKDKFSVLKKQAVGIFGLNITFKKDEDFDEKEEFMEQLDAIMDPLKDNCTFEEFLKLVPELYALRNRYRFDVNGKLNELFTRDYAIISQEIAKYDEIIETEYKETRIGGEKNKAVEKRARKRKLRSYFMKTKESSNARMGAYLCIAGDTNMWKNKNYFELVTKDEETGESRGVVMLLNIEAKDGKRYLWFGPNPYESLLTQVATKPMYDYLYKTVADFAAENGFDGIVVPEESKILGACTNRGGEFPELIKQSMLRDRQGALKEVEFGESHMLGGSYGYSKGVLVWQKEKTMPKAA